MTQDTYHTILGVTIAFGFPLMVFFSIFVLVVGGWLVYTVFSMTSPVWKVIYVLFRAVLYFSLWYFILAGVCWLCGWSDPINWGVRFYSAAPGAIFHWFTK
jgi:hypothetical protein